MNKPDSRIVVLYRRTDTYNQSDSPYAEERRNDQENSIGTPPAWVFFQVQ